MTKNHSIGRTFLASELKIAREEAGKTQAQVAKLVYVSDNLVTQWETARRVPQPDHLAQLEEIYGTKGRLTRIREKLVNSTVPLEWAGRWLEIEAKATSLWSFETMVAPGLLQTEDYARTILRSGQHRYVDIDEMVTTRMKRKEILTREDNPTFLVALISESVLRHNVGGSKIMRDQLAHLIIEMAERDNVVIQVITDTAKACSGFTGPFVIADFDGGNSVAYMDNALEGDVAEDTEDVARLRRMFDTLRSDAEKQPESIDLIRKMMVERWQDKT